MLPNLSVVWDISRQAQSRVRSCGGKVSRYRAVKVPHVSRPTAHNMPRAAWRSLVARWSLLCGVCERGPKGRARATQIGVEYPTKKRTARKTACSPASVMVAPRDS